METINKITTSKQTTMYDHLCKMIIGNEEVLSRIIKAAVDEANHLNVEEIRRLIKGVHIGDLIVNPHFHLVDKKGFIKDEGMVYYDILLLPEDMLMFQEQYQSNGEANMMIKTMMG